jgi:pilus assembly protein CpaB
MKPARLIVLAVALAAGGVAAMLASGSRTPEAPKAPPPPPPLATVEVLVAKSDLEPAQVVTEGDVGWQTWPSASTGSNVIRKTDRPEAIKDFIGAIVRAPVLAGEPIRDSKVVAANGRGFMATILPHGLRAFSLDIAPDTDAGGFILPNDHVDVVLTQKPTGNGRQDGPDVVSKTILSNVRVLAVDQTIGDKEGQKVIIGKTATIQVDPQQAEMLANARQQGTVSLALRSIVDSQATTPERQRPKTYHVVNVYFGGDGSDEKRPRVTYVCEPDCYHANRQTLSEITTRDDGQAEATSALTSDR